MIGSGLLKQKKIRVLAAYFQKKLSGFILSKWGLRCVLSGGWINQFNNEEHQSGFRFPALGRGIYLLRIIDGEGQIETHRLWVQ